MEMENDQEKVQAQDVIFTTETPVRKAVQPANYMSTRANLSLRLRPPIRININGRERRKPGLRANFVNHRLTTRNADIIEELDSMLCGEAGHWWQRKFYKVPSPEVTQKMAKAQAKAQEVAKREMDKTMDDTQRKDLSGWQDFLKRQKNRLDEQKIRTKAVARTYDTGD